MRKIKFIYLVLALAATWSCTKDFVVKDIKNASVTIIAPVNNLTTPNNAIIFWWEEVDGAEKYNIQIVKPNFNSIQQLLVDTNVTGDKFHYTLTPGTYQWRIRAKNAGGNTQFTTFNLVIDTTSNLATQVISPISPVNNHITGSTTVAFSWNSLAAATNYQIQVLNSSSTIVQDVTTANTTFTATLSGGGVYTWKVRAMNAFSLSQYNAPLTFTVDVTAPTVSILSSPGHGAQVKDTVSLKWTRSSADARYDILYISTDSSFTSVVSTTTVYPTSIKINAISPALPVTSSYYWWRLRSVDSVGNNSGYSSQLKFRLIP
jgi:predicted secreted protein